jgi:hypothetical protein
MAGIDFIGNIAASVPNQFAKEGVDAWNEAAPLMGMMDFEFEFTGSTAVFWSIGFSGVAGGFVSEGSNVDNATELGARDITKAQLNRAIARTGFGFTHTELATVRSMDASITPDVVVDRLKKAWLNSLSYECRVIEVQAAIGTGTVTDNSGTFANTQGPVGFIYAALTVANGGQYAGLTNAYGAWNPSVTNAGGAALTASDLDHMIANLQTNANIFPKAIMMSPKTFTTFKEVLGDGLVRIWSMGTPAAYELGVRDMKNAVVGGAVASYDGIPVYVNSAWAGTVATATQAGLDGYIAAFRPEDLVCNILPYESWVDAVLSEKRNGVESYAQIVKKLGLPFYTYSLYKPGATLRMAMELEHQFRVKSLNRIGVIYNLAVS